MKIIVAGPRECDDFAFVEKAIVAAKSEGLEITELVSGGAQGVDKLAEQWADMNNIPKKVFVPDWNNIDVPGAIVRENKFKRKYNAKAGADRNAKMADYAEALIAVKPSGPTDGTHDMIKQAKAKGLKVFIFDGQNKPDNEFDFVF